MPCLIYAHFGELRESSIFLQPPSKQLILIGEVYHCNCPKLLERGQLFNIHFLVSVFLKLQGTTVPQAISALQEGSAPGESPGLWLPRGLLAARGSRVTRSQP